MAPDSLTPGGTATIDVNGRSYRLPQRPTVVVCVDGSEPGYIEPRGRGRRGAVVRAHPARGHEPARRLRGAELHQPEQPLDRHRPAAFGAWHQRQLLPRSRERERGDDERSEVPARRDAVSGVPARRPAHRGDHREGQAARPAGQGTRAGARQGLQLLLREGDQARSLPTASTTCWRWAVCRYPTFTARASASSSSRRA